MRATKHPFACLASSVAGDWSRPARRGVLTLIIALVVAACAGAPPGQPGQSAPPLSGTTLDGSTLDLAALHGSPVVVNFWKSDCVPCRDEFPLLKTALADHAREGLAIVGVDFRDSDDLARAFEQQFGATWPSITDPDHSRQSAWGVVAPPQTYFIGRDGVIKSRQIGQLTSNDLDRQLDAILR